MATAPWPRCSSRDGASRLLLVEGRLRHHASVHCACAWPLDWRAMANAEASAGRSQLLDGVVGTANLVLNQAGSSTALHMPTWAHARRMQALAQLSLSTTSFTSTPLTTRVQRSTPRPCDTLQHSAREGAPTKPPRRCRRRRHACLPRHTPPAALVDSRATTYTGFASAQRNASAHGGAQAATRQAAQHACTCTCTLDYPTPT